MKAYGEAHYFKRHLSEKLTVIIPFNAFIQIALLNLLFFFLILTNPRLLDILLKSNLRPPHNKVAFFFFFIELAAFVQYFDRLTDQLSSPLIPLFT